VASLSQGRTAAAQCGLFTHKSVPVIFEPPCILHVQDGCNKEIAPFSPVRLSRLERYCQKFYIHIWS